MSRYSGALILLSILLISAISSHGTILNSILDNKQDYFSYDPKFYQWGQVQFYKDDPSKGYSDIDLGPGQAVWAPDKQVGDFNDNDESISYLVKDESQNSANLSPIETAKLIDALTKLGQMTKLVVTKDDVDPKNILPSFDLNSHWPASLNPNTEKFISDPVNDPEEFEAILSYLTNKLNYQVPNSSNRSAILESLLSNDIGSIIGELRRESSRYQEDNNNQSPSAPIVSSNLVRNEDIKIHEDLKEPSEGAIKKLSIAVAQRQSDSSPVIVEPTISRYGSSEYIDHPLALVGHQYVQGGAGEGRQLLGPDGMFENVQVIKSDRPVPSYCNPPNPCPIGYTADDGCIEEFINSASFSREYQAKQKCSCDNEHSLFNCEAPGSTLDPDLNSQGGNSIDGNSDEDDSDGDKPRPIGYNIVTSQGGKAAQLSEGKLTTLARAVMNRFGELGNLVSGA